VEQGKNAFYCTRPFYQKKEYSLGDFGRSIEFDFRRILDGRDELLVNSLVCLLQKRNPISIVNNVMFFLVIYY
jgi:hypothetical protein